MRPPPASPSPASPPVPSTTCIMSCMGVAMRLRARERGEAEQEAEAERRRGGERATVSVPASFRLSRSPSLSLCTRRLVVLRRTTGCTTGSRITSTEDGLVCGSGVWGLRGAAGGRAVGRVMLVECYVCHVSDVAGAGGARDGGNKQRVRPTARGGSSYEKAHREAGNTPQCVERVAAGSLWQRRSQS